MTEGLHTVTFWSEDGAGNVEATQSVQVWIDQTAPVVTYTGNRATYTITDQVTITCTPGDRRLGNESGDPERYCRADDARD